MPGPYRTILLNYMGANNIKSITLSFGENFIERLADIILDRFGKTTDYSRVACVFGGKRPGLFLRKALANRIGTSFVPPKVFSMDDFVDWLVGQGKPLAGISDLDAGYILYKLAKKNASGVLKEKKSFNEFLPWAREVVSFIEQLDLEGIPDEKLLSIKASAQIGFDVPESINKLLESMGVLRKLYHEELAKQGVMARGKRYSAAGALAAGNNLDDFDAVLFCNFFYLHATEGAIIKAVLDSRKGSCIFQGDEAEWPVLAHNAKLFGSSIVPGALSASKRQSVKVNLSLHEGFDLHSQVCICRDIINTISDKEKTLILLPQPEAVVPLLSEISSNVDEFNVSMGYPLKRSVVCSLFEYLVRAVESKKGDKYYARDYLQVMRHPLIKNIDAGFGHEATRVLVHKLEEALDGEIESDIGGTLFIDLEAIEKETVIYRGALEILKAGEIKVSLDDCRAILKYVHDTVLRGWEATNDFAGFSRVLEALLDTLSRKSYIGNYPFNIKALEKLFNVKDELAELSFKHEKFNPEELWLIFLQKIKSELLSFSGSPLKGLQILGLFETRSLNFDNVIALDLNESVMPRLKIYEPLIPREVMLQLGINRLEKEEEIQRYQFMRLINGAKRVHLIYEETKEKEKSRFVEELIWQRQKETGRLDVLEPQRAAFNLAPSLPQNTAKKTPEMVARLLADRYSASRLNVYLSCPLKFYYTYCLGLKEKRGLLDDPRADSIGTFIHELLEETLGKFKGVQPIIDEEFSRYFFNVMEKRFNETIKRRMKSDSFLLWGILQDRMRKFLEEEKRRDVKKILALEERIEGVMKLSKHEVTFGYTADRVDELRDDSIVIIDYKTGSSDVQPKSLSGLSKMELTRQNISESMKSFQLPIYYYFISRQFPGKQVNAQLYNIRTLDLLPFIRPAEAKQREEVMTVCLRALDFIFEEIINPEVDFVAVPDEQRCSYCSFKSACGI